MNDDETPLVKDQLIVSIDTTVQEKNITISIDNKQYKKVINHCRKLAKK